MKKLVHPVLFVAAFAIASLAVASCSTAEAGPDRAVDGAEAVELVRDDDATLVDVRTPAEYERGHVEGALNVPLQTLPEAASGIDRSRPVVVYCHSGGRSAEAARLLAREGYDVHDLGPMSAWPQ